jgi:trimethylamine--corrinoid protein Co-methyltransferase
MATCQISILSEDEIELVHEKTLSLLDRPGIKVESERALKLLEEGGAKVDHGSMTARLPESLINETIKKMPKEIVLGARNPKQDMRAPRPGAPYMATNGTAVYMTDLETGQKRPTQGKDLADFMTLCDAVDALDYVWPIVTAHDGPEHAHGLNEMIISLKNTTKHVQGEAMSGREARDMVEAAALVAGGEDALRKRPLFSVIQCPICPLEFERGSVEAVIEFARAGIPVVSMSMALCGLTAPVTLASTITIVNAENLASFAISQLASKGAPVVYSSESSIINMKTGEIHYGASEEVIIAAAVGQMAKHYGALTMVGSYGLGLRGTQPGITADPAELAFSAATNLSLTDFSSGVGGLDQAKGSSLEQIIIDSDVWESCREMLRDVKLDEEHFVNDLIAKVGPGGNFLGVPHTARNMRKELFLPSQEKASIYENYIVSKDRQEMVSKARDRVKRILATHKADPIDADIVKEIDAIVARQY